MTTFFSLKIKIDAIVSWWFDELYKEKKRFSKCHVNVWLDREGKRHL